VVVAVDPAGVVAMRWGDCVEAALAAVAEDDTTIEQLDEGVAGQVDVVGVSRPAAAKRLSVGAGFMIAMAAACIDTTTVTSGDGVLPRRRGKSKAPNFKYDGPVSVIRLELDVSDPVVRRRVERQWAAVFRLRRALQRDAAHRCRAYWAARRERTPDQKGLRARLGLCPTLDRHPFANVSGRRAGPPRVG
jgi:hypothetical protein